MHANAKQFHLARIRRVRGLRPFLRCRWTHPLPENKSSRIRENLSSRTSPHSSAISTVAKVAKVAKGLVLSLVLSELRRKRDADPTAWDQTPR